MDLDLRRVNILIGDQGTGKSTVAKVLSILKSASQSLLFETISGKDSDENQIEKLKNERFSKHFFEYIKLYDLNNYLNDMTQIRYENDYCICKLQNNKTNFFLTKLNYEQSIIKDSSVNYFIPAFRESYILLRNSYPAILLANAKLPQLLNQFGQNFNNYREELKHFDLKSIIGVDYKYINGNDLIVLDTGEIITFEESSSAVNSVVPMLVVFLGVINEMSQDKYRILYNHNCPFVTIEEPELNCYPSTQKKLVEFLIEKIKFKDYEKSNEYYVNLLLTTHSPYMLTTLNNLMYSYNVGKEHFEETDKIIPSKNWLNPNDVSAYRLNERGISEDIFDREESLIKAEKIDEISTALNKDFNKLINIEIGLVNEKH